MITLSQLSLLRGGRCLLQNVQLTINPGEHVGLIGANGCGKSSLFLLLRGVLHADEGECQIANGLTLSWAEQDTPALDRSARDYVLDGDDELRAIERQLNDAEAQHDGNAIGRLHAKLDAIDAWTAPSRAAQLLDGLGFDADAQLRAIKTFSGGWRMRLNLAQALMRRADILLLDEPTNHLDLDAVIWLEQLLKKYTGTLILISHDREFLDGVCSHIAHIENQHINKYHGDYSAFERQRGERLQQAQAAYTKQQTQRAHLQSFVDRFRAQATKAKQAQSRLKALEKLTLTAPIDEASHFEFEFPPPRKQPSPLISTRDVQLGYGDHVVLRQIKLTLTPGARIGLLGRNGAGKSTFIRFLANELRAQCGERQDGLGLQIGYFAQHSLETLTPEHSAFDHLRQLDKTASEAELRGFLGSFGFSADKALTPVAPFSGGEKARLCLALLVYQRPNLILLDEPTNHLDLDMRESLTEALQRFVGAVVLVSHDRHLLTATCDDFWLVADGRLQPFDGDLDDYAQWLLRDNSDGKNSNENANPLSSVARKDRKRIEADQRKLRQPLTQRVKQLDELLAKQHQQLQRVQSRLAEADIYFDANKNELKNLLAEQTSLQQTLHVTEEEWLEKSEALECLIKQHEQELA